MHACVLLEEEVSDLCTGQGTREITSVYDASEVEMSFLKYFYYACICISSCIDAALGKERFPCLSLYLFSLNGIAVFVHGCIDC